MNEEALRAWLANEGLGKSQIVALAGDLSQRRYVRVVPVGAATQLVAVYPETLRGTMGRFVEAKRLLAEAGVRVPAVHRVDLERGLMLIEDLGPETLYELEDATGTGRLAFFRVAAEIAETIAGLDPVAVDALGSPRLDADLLRRELDATFEHLFDPRGLAGLPELRRALRSSLGAMCEELAQGPLVACHRDYMARNLVPAGGDLAVIDFQDLRLGPRGYDLASLLNDSFFPSPQIEEELLPSSWKAPDEHAQYARAVVQRGLKAAGTFARFAAAGNPRHLALIPRSLERAARHLAALPETAATYAAVREWWTTELSPGSIC